MVGPQVAVRFSPVRRIVHRKSVIPGQKEPVAGKIVLIAGGDVIFKGGLDPEGVVKGGAFGDAGMHGPVEMNPEMSLELLMKPANRLPERQRAEQRGVVRHKNPRHTIILEPDGNRSGVSPALAENIAELLGEQFDGTIPGVDSEIPDLAVEHRPVFPGNHEGQRVDLLQCV